MLITSLICWSCYCRGYLFSSFDYVSGTEWVSKVAIQSFLLAPTEGCWNNPRCDLLPSPKCFQPRFPESSYSFPGTVWVPRLTGAGRVDHERADPIHPPNAHGGEKLGNSLSSQVQSEGAWRYDVLLISTWRNFPWRWNFTSPFSLGFDARSRILKSDTCCQSHFPFLNP